MFLIWINFLSQFLVKFFFINFWLLWIYIFSTFLLCWSWKNWFRLKSWRPIMILINTWNIKTQNWFLEIFFKRMGFLYILIFLLNFRQIKHIKTWKLFWSKYLDLILFQLYIFRLQLNFSLIKKLNILTSILNFLWILI